jgi:hypothetical protein
MHDGKSIYDAEITWNKQAWEVDEIASKLNEKKNEAIIVVEFGIMVQKRHEEYFPQNHTRFNGETKVTKKLKKKKKENFRKPNPISDLYLKF